MTSYSHIRFLTTMVVFLAVAIVASGFSSSKAHAGNSFLGGFFVGAITGAVVSHVIHQEWQHGSRAPRRSAKSKPASADTQKSSSAETEDPQAVAENKEASGKGSDTSVSEKKFQPSLQPSTDTSNK